jgi:hypothetical protein
MTTTTAERFTHARHVMRQETAVWLTTGGFGGAPEDFSFILAVTAYTKAFDTVADENTFRQLMELAGEVLRTAITPPPAPTVWRNGTTVRVTTGPDTFTDYRVDNGVRAWIVCALMNPLAVTGAGPVWVPVGVSPTLPAAKARVAAVCTGRVAGYTPRAERLDRRGRSLMCRVDDDYSWLVGAKRIETVTPDVKRQCEDCYRVLGIGETFEEIFEDEEGREDDDRPYVLVASHTAGTWDKFAFTSELWAQKTYNIVGPCVDDAEAADLFEATFDALGFYVEKEKDPRIEVPEIAHVWCLQCRAANEWLVKVCDQSTVLAACHDLADHLGEYSLPELGIDFGRVVVLANHKWRTHQGRLVDVAMVEALTARAIAHAEAAGMVVA